MVYDLKARGSVPHIGDRVLVKKLRSDKPGRNKLADRWESDVYVIVDKPNADIPVYHVVKEDDKNGKVKPLHRNLI